MALLHVSFFSETLGLSTSMDVVLPQPTKNQIGMTGKVREGGIPTLYLLHGMSDDQTIWQRRTSIERYVSELGIAVVMPTTGLGWYTNTTYGMRYWDFISDELPKICRSFFPQLSTKREETFACGLSMGGYGAFKLGLGAADTFGYAASLSGALDMTNRSERPMNENEKKFWTGVFGPMENVKDSENDLFKLARDLKASGKPLTKLYAWCGTEDFLHDDNLRAVKYLKELGFDLIYEESSGDHQWKYWDEKVQSVLKWLPLGM